MDINFLNKKKAPKKKPKMTDIFDMKKTKAASASVPPGPLKAVAPNKVNYKKKK